MFSGIVEEVGAVLTLQRQGSSATLRTAARKVLEGTRVGDSIAINGACLTVTNLATEAFTADVSPETLQRTKLANLAAGSRVNLERGLVVGGRVGGHFVQGHIDGVGQVSALKQEGNAVMARFSAAPDIMRYIVAKGFIAVDGTSLTVVTRFSDSFSVSLVPHTRSSSIAGSYQVGQVVNLEVDILGKYVEQLLSGCHSEGVLSREALERYGFLN